MSVSHDSDPKLACNLYANDGRTLRFGPDEPDAANAVTAISFGTEVPGWGFAEGSVTLNRPESLSALDNDLFARAKVYDEAGRTVYEGRVVKLTRSGTSELTIDLEGPLAHLDDDSTARMIYRDTDLSNWQGMSLGRQAAVHAGASRTPSDGESIYDPEGDPGIKLACTSPWGATEQPDIEMWYDAGPGLLVGWIWGAWARQANTTNANWWWSLAAANDSAGATGYASTGDLQSEPTANSTAQWGWPAGNKRWVFMDLVYTGGASPGVNNAEFAVTWTNLAVYGNHGVTVRGTEPDAGLYASDIVADALGRWAPLVKIAPAGIRQSVFIIGQLAFRDLGTTARNVIEAVSAYGATGFDLPDWGYYEDGFFWAPPGSYGRTWRLRRDEGAVAVDEGPSAETRCNGFVVNYSDAAGTSKSVGPVDSGCDYETDLLADPDPANPVNIAAIPRRYGSRDVGVTTQDGAVLLGQLLLRRANTRHYSGSAEVQGTVRDDTGATYPAYMIRAGDFAVFEDDESATPRKIVSTSYSDGTTSLTLDNKSTALDVALQRLDVASKPAGF